MTATPLPTPGPRAPGGPRVPGAHSWAAVLPLGPFCVLGPPGGAGLSPGRSTVLFEGEGTFGEVQVVGGASNGLRGFFFFFPPPPFPLYFRRGGRTGQSALVPGPTPCTWSWPTPGWPWWGWPAGPPPRLGSLLSWGLGGGAMPPCTSQRGPLPPVGPHRRRGDRSPAGGGGGTGILRLHPGCPPAGAWWGDGPGLRCGGKVTDQVTLPGEATSLRDALPSRERELPRARAHPPVPEAVRSRLAPGGVCVYEQRSPPPPPHSPTPSPPPCSPPGSRSLSPELKRTRGFARHRRQTDRRVASRCRAGPGPRLGWRRAGPFARRGQELGSDLPGTDRPGGGLPSLPPPGGEVAGRTRWRSTCRFLRL